MAENKLEGFEDFDNSAGGAKAGGELDDLLGKGESGGAAGGGGDSELDSFFEDLSTIDDLEVAQEQPKASVAAPAAAAAPAARQEAAAPAPKAPKKPRAPAQPGRLRKILVYLVLLAVFGGGGYYVYVTYIAGDAKIPWPTFPTKIPGLPRPRVDDPPQPVEPRPHPTQTMRPPKAPPRPTGPGFGIQVATCFFDSCVDSYKALLSDGNNTVRVKERMTQSETLEVYSQTAFASRLAAHEAAEKVNLDNRLEGHAYIIEEGKAFRLSMGAFQDLSRANVVKDTLNQRYGGQIVFAQRVKSVPYALKVVMTGAYPTRAEAEQALEKFRAMDRSLTGAFVVPNEK